MQSNWGSFGFKTTDRIWLVVEGHSRSGPWTAEELKHRLERGENGPTAHVSTADHHGPSGELQELAACLKDLPVTGGSLPPRPHPSDGGRHPTKPADDPAEGLLDALRVAKETREKKAHDHAAAHGEHATASPEIGKESSPFSDKTLHVMAALIGVGLLFLVGLRVVKWLRTPKPATVAPTFTPAPTPAPVPVPATATPASRSAPPAPVARPTAPARVIPPPPPADRDRDRDERREDDLRAAGVEPGSDRDRDDRRENPSSMSAGGSGGGPAPEETSRPPGQGNAETDAPQSQDASKQDGQP